jgi:deoxyribodipyrimidine photolyase-related protein
MSAVTLVYPQQLFDRHPALREGQPLLLIEDPLYFGGDPRWPLAVHKQRLLLHRASMKAWAAGKGMLRYIEAPEAGIGSVELLERELPGGVCRLELADPCDDVLSRRLRRFADKRGLELVVHPSPNFLSPPELLEKFTGPSRKRPFMADFYKAQRQRMGILLESDGSPVGGKWSFDEENRQRFPEDQLAPPEPRVAPDDHVREALAYVERRFPNNPGRAEGFHYPVTRAAAWSGSTVSSTSASTTSVPTRTPSRGTTASSSTRCSRPP